MKVLIAAGGTLGHLYPAVRLSKELKKIKQDFSILFITSKKQKDIEVLAEENIIFKTLPIEGISSGFRAIIRCIPFKINLIISLFRTINIIKKFSPDVIVGFGGYVSFWPILIGKLFGKYIIIHEQNYKLGRVNKLLSKIANKVAVSFPLCHCEERSNAATLKMVYTGYPLAKNIKKIPKQEALNYFKLSKEKKTILIMGGTQGSHNINLNFSKMLLCFNEQVLNKIQIIHICGEKDYQFIKNTYNNLNVECKLFSFFKKINIAYSCADVVIARAGAGTVAEIIFFGLPAIFIPYPYAGGHQKLNIFNLIEQKAAIMIKDNMLTPHILLHNVMDLIEDKLKLEKMSEKLSKFKIDNAGEKLAKLVLNYKGCYSDEQSDE